MPGVEIKLFNKIQEIPRQDWESIFTKELEGYGFFRAIDEESFSGLRLHYALFYKDGAVVGGTVFFLMNFQLDMAVQGWLRHPIRALKKVFPRIFGVKILFCGLPMSHGIISFKSDQEEVLKSILECMEKLSAQHKALAVVFKDFGHEYDEFLSHLSTYGFVRTKSLPTTVMKINFNDMEGYLKTLSRSSREGLKRKFKHIDQGPKIDMEIVKHVDKDLSEQMYGLYRQTVGNSEVEFEELTKVFFANMSEHDSERSRFFIWRLEGKVVAFAHCMVIGDYFVDYYLGFDYSVAYKYNLYFIRFRDLMNWCIENKMRVYEMGQSSYEAKRRLGFEFVPLYVYSKPTKKFLIPLAHFYNRFLVFEKFEPVFKHMEKKS